MIPLFTESSNLSNEGTTLTLRDSRHRVIHSVEYSSGWYAGTFKENGGWSLEMADPGNPCGCNENWQASTDGSGGTPGRINSTFCTNPDLDKPSLERAFIESPHILRLRFSEKMDSTGLSARETWETSQGMGVPDSLVMMGPGYSSIGLYY